jgi:hypothetical protein
MLPCQGAWPHQTNLWRERTNPREGVRATKRYRPEGDLREAKKKHHLPPPQSEEAEFDPAPERCLTTLSALILARQIRNHGSDYTLGGERRLLDAKATVECVDQILL